MKQTKAFSIALFLQRSAVRSSAQPYLQLALSVAPACSISRLAVSASRLGLAASLLGKLCAAAFPFSKLRKCWQWRTQFALEHFYFRINASGSVFVSLLSAGRMLSAPPSVLGSDLRDGLRWDIGSAAERAECASDLAIPLRHVYAGTDSANAPL